MRAGLLAIILGAALTVGIVAPAGASAAVAPRSSSSVTAAATTVDSASFAGTRVKVQLVTLGAVLILVVGVGSASYFVRKKLGLDVQSEPDEPPSSQH